MMTQNNSHIIDIFKQIKNQELSIAVAVEGGGLRGIVSASLLKVLNDFGLAANVKAISGTSSGAINAAYFLNNDLTSCFELYRNMASKNFIQPLRWPNAMNLDYLFEDKIKKHFPIAVSTNNKCPFFVSVTDVSTGRGEYLTARSQKELHHLLRASTSAPVFTTNKEYIGNKHYNDGHIELAVPFDAFDVYKFDYILCLLTQPKNYLKKKSQFSKFIEKIALINHNKKFKISYSKSANQYNDRLKQIYESKKIIPIAVNTNTFVVSKMTTNPSDVDKCIESVLENFL